MDTISTLSSRTDCTFNLKRRLDSSKQQVILLKKENKKQHEQIGMLKSQIKKVNYDLMNEKNFKYITS